MALKRERNENFLTLKRALLHGGFSAVFFISVGFGCSSVPFSEPPETMDSVAPPSDSIPEPVTLALPHPEDASISSLESLFAAKSSPLWDTAVALQCEQPIEALRQRAGSHGELESGMSEFIRKDPVMYHWCFYGKLLDLERSLSKEVFILEKQALVLKTFKLIAPISRAFMRETTDARYYRYSIRRYQELTERVFFRKLEVLPEVTERLVNLHQLPNREAPAAGTKTPTIPKHSDQGGSPEKPSAVAQPGPDPWKELDRYPAEESD
jgi:hypothetical protein